MGENQEGPQIRIGKLNVKGKVTTVKEVKIGPDGVKIEGVSKATVDNPPPAIQLPDGIKVGELNLGETRYVPEEGEPHRLIKTEGAENRVTVIDQRPESQIGVQDAVDRIRTVPFRNEVTGTEAKHIVRNMSLAARDGEDITENYGVVRNVISEYGYLTSFSGDQEEAGRLIEIWQQAQDKHRPNDLNRGPARGARNTVVNLARVIKEKDWESLEVGLLVDDDKFVNVLPISPDRKVQQYLNPAVLKNYPK